MQSSNINLINHPNHSDSDLLLPLGKRRLCLKRMNESSSIHNQNLPKNCISIWESSCFSKNLFIDRQCAQRRWEYTSQKDQLYCSTFRQQNLGALNLIEMQRVIISEQKKKPYWGRGEKTCCECTMYNCTSYPANLHNPVLCASVFCLFVCYFHLLCTSGEKETNPANLILIFVHLWAISPACTIDQIPFLREAAQVSFSLFSSQDNWTGFPAKKTKPPDYPFKSELRLIY